MGNKIIFKCDPPTNVEEFLALCLGALMMREKRFVTYSDIARYLDCTPSTITRWRNCGTIPLHRAEILVIRLEIHPFDVKSLKKVNI